MLNILLLILKIAGILILSVIGLILLLVFLIIFIPVRYSVSAKYYQKVPYARLKISWLLNLLKVQAVYDKEFKADVRLLWFRLYPKRDKKNKNKKTYNSADFEDAKTISDSDNITNKDSIASASADETLIKEKEITQSVSYSSNKTEAHDEAQKEHKEHKKSFIRRAADAIRSFINRIIHFFRNLKEKKDDLKEKINNILKIVNDPENRKMAEQFFSILKNLLKHIKPRKFDAYVHYGFEDIETTGKVAMYAAVLYGLIGADIKIYPDFEQQIFEGEVFLKGHIRLFWLVIAAMKVYTNKQFKKLFLKK